MDVKKELHYMVHQRFIKKKGKVYGPYFYDSFREDGKVKKYYYGMVHPHQKKVSFRKFFAALGILFIFAVALFSYYYIIQNEISSVTGKVIFDVETQYQFGEPLSGKLKLNLKSGEFIPADSIVRISLGNQTKDIALSEISDLALGEGQFYVEGSQVSGDGGGFGVIGQKIIYPIVNFEMLVFASEVNESSEIGNETGTIGEGSGNVSGEDVQDSNESSSEPIANGGSGSSETPSEIPSEITPEQPTAETPIEETSPSTEQMPQKETAKDSDKKEEDKLKDGNRGNGNSEAPAQTPASEPASAPASESSSEPASAPSESPITGSAISESEFSIFGEASKEKHFNYALEKGQSAKIVSGSVKVGNESLSDDIISLSVRGRNAKASTEYKIVEEGYGPEFLGKNAASISISFESFGLITNSNILNIELIYMNESIISVQKKLDVTGINETILLNETGNASAFNLSLIKPIPDIKINVNGTFELNMSEYFANAESYEFAANNLSSIVVEDRMTISPDAGFKGSRRAIITAFAGNESISSNEFGILVYGGAFNVVTDRDKIRLNEPVKWYKNISLETPDNVTIELPKEAENISVRVVNSEDGNIKEVAGISGRAVQGTGIESNEPKIVELIRKLIGGITGRAITEDLSEPSGINVELNESASEYLIEYTTPAPVSVEQESASGKVVSISGPDNLNYTDVLSYANIKEVVEVGNEAQIKIYWREQKEYMPFDAYDMDGNGVLDYVEWNVPHLSNQTFEIILIIKAEHLDSNRTFIEDVYENVSALDGAYASIPVGHYLRVTFEQNLTSGKDITIYASSLSNASVIVYETDGNISLADFGAMNENISEHKIYLINLTSSRTEFDLLVYGEGSVEFDYVVDPLITYLSNGTGNTAFRSEQDPLNKDLAVGEPNTTAYSAAELTTISAKDGNVVTLPTTVGSGKIATKVVFNLLNQDKNAITSLFINSTHGGGAGGAGKTFLQQGMAIRNYSANAWYKVVDEAAAAATLKNETKLINLGISDFINGSSNAEVMVWGNCTYATILCGFSVDWIQLDVATTNITLITPTNKNKNTTNPQNFYATINSTESQALLNATLYLWYLNGTLVNTNSTPATNFYNETNQSLTLPSGNEIYLWNYLVCNDVNNCLFAPANFTLDMVNPNLTFVNPTRSNAYADNENNTIQINVSIQEDFLSSLNYTFNGTTYSYYNDSLLAFFNFDNNSLVGDNLTTIKDLSRYGNDGIVISGGGVYNSSGKYGSAFQGNRAGYIKPYAKATHFFDNMAGLTIGVWVNPSNLTGVFSGIVTRSVQIGLTTDDDFGLFIDNRTTTRYLAFEIANTTNVKFLTIPIGNLTFYNWNYLTATYNGSDASIYLNGFLQNTTAWFGIVNNASRTFKIGSTGYCEDFGCTATLEQNFSGKIDDVKIWSRGLTANEVYQEYASSLSKLNATSWNLYINQSANISSGLNNGTYNYGLCGKDVAGSVGCTDTRAVIIGAVGAVADTTAPKVFLIAPSNGTTITNSNLSFNATFTDETALANASLFVWNASGDIINYTTRTASGTLNGTNITIDLYRFGNFTWNYWVCDNSSNCAWNLTNWSVQYAAPAGGTPDTTLPIVRLINPGNNSLFSVPTIWFGANITDNLNISNFTIYVWNATSNAVVNSSFKWATGTTYNLSNFSIVLQNEGNYSWNVYAYDNSSNLGYNLTNWTFEYSTQRDIIAPKVFLVHPTNNTLSNNATIWFAGNFSDETNLANATLYVWNASMDIVNQTNVSLRNLINNTNLSITLVRQGNYTWNFYIYDNSTNLGWNLTNWSVIYIPIVGIPPNATNYSTDYGTTNFSAIANYENVTGLVLGGLYAKIKFLGNYSVNTSGENYNQQVISGPRFVAVNTSRLNPTFNYTTNVTLNAVYCTSPVVYYNDGFYNTSSDIISTGSVCNATTNPSCTEIVCTGGNLSFMAQHFTSYASLEFTNLTIWDSTDAGMPFAGLTKYANDDVRFYANYSNNTIPLSGGNCTISYNATNNVSMVYNTTAFVFQDNRSYSASGTYNFSINCSLTGYASLNATDNASISSVESIVYLYPNRDIVAPAVTGDSVLYVVGGDEVHHFSAIRKKTLQPNIPDDSSYSIMSGMTNEGQYEMSDYLLPEGAQVKSVTLWLYMKEAVSPNTARANISIAGVWQNSTDIGWDASEKWYNTTIRGNWNQSDLNSITVQITRTGISPARRIDVHEIYTQINYTVAQGATTVNFTAPTKANNTIVYNKTAYVNVSIHAPNLLNVTFNWNGTNYSAFDDSLLLAYGFENISALGENSTYFLDYSGYDSHGTINSTANISYVPGLFGNALNFSSLGTATRVISRNNGTTLWSNFTYTVFANSPNVGNRGCYVFTGKSSTNALTTMHYLYFNDSAVTMFEYDSGNSVRLAISNISLSTDKWYSLATTVNDTTIRLFIDGEVKGSISFSGLAADDTDFVYIGPGNCMIDEPRIWKRILSDAEIQQQAFMAAYKTNKTNWLLGVNQNATGSVGLSNGNYTYYAYSRDVEGTSNSTEARTIQISSATPDTTAPKAFLVAPSNGTTITNSNLSFNATFTDETALANASLFVWNASGDIINYTTGTVSGTLNGTNTSINLYRFGNFTWNYWVCDNSSNCAWNLTNWSLEFATFSDATAPLVNLINPANNSLMASATIYFGGNFTDNYGLANATLYVWNASMDIVNQTNVSLRNRGNSTNLSITLVREGNYTWNFYAYDNSTNLGWNLTNWSVQYLAETPQILLSRVYPGESSNQINATQGLFFNVTVNVTCFSVNCSEINVSLDPTTTRQYFPNSTGSAAWSNSSHPVAGFGISPLAGSLTERAYNSSDLDSISSLDSLSYARGGGWGAGGTIGAAQSRVKFIITESAEAISRIEIKSYSLMSATWSTVNSTLWIKNMSSSTWVHLNSSIGASTNFTAVILNGFSDYINSTGSSVEVDVLGTAGGLNAGSYTLYIDSVSLEIDSSSSSKGLINTTIGATPFYTNESNPRNISLSANQSQLVIFWVNATGTAGNSYEFFAYANKTSSMSIGNITTTWNVSIVAPVLDTTLPIVRLINPANNSRFNISTIWFGANITDNLNISNFTIYVWNATSNAVVNSSFKWATGTTYNLSNFSIVLQNQGNYSWNVYAYDNSSNLGYNLTNWTFEYAYDTTPPLVTISSPTNTTYTESSYVINISINEAGICNYTLNGGSTNTTLTANSTNTGFTGSKSGAANGAYTLYAYCKDNLGNMNNTENVSFNVNVAAAAAAASTSTAAAESWGCASKYSCSAWKCDGKNYTRTCKDTRCSRKDVVEVNGTCKITPKCTPNWVLGNWSECNLTTGKANASYYDANNCGKGTKPKDKQQNCGNKCDLSCGAWGNCVFGQSTYDYFEKVVTLSGLQTRTCPKNILKTLACEMTRACSQTKPLNVSVSLVCEDKYYAIRNETDGLVAFILKADYDAKKPNWIFPFNGLTVEELCPSNETQTSPENGTIIETNLTNGTIIEGNMTNGTTIEANLTNETVTEGNITNESLISEPSNLIGDIYDSLSGYAETAGGYIGDAADASITMIRKGAEASRIYIRNVDVDYIWRMRFILILVLIALLILFFLLLLLLWKRKKKEEDKKAKKAAKNNPSMKGFLNLIYMRKIR